MIDFHLIFTFKASPQHIPIRAGPQTREAIATHFRAYRGVGAGKGGPDAELIADDSVEIWDLLSSSPAAKVRRAQPLDVGRDARTIRVWAAQRK